MNAAVKVGRGVPNESRFGIGTKPQMHPLTAYYEAGRMAGKARRQKDQGACAFHTEWAQRASRLEEMPYANHARAAFNRGYREEL